MTAGRRPVVPVSPGVIAIIRLRHIAPCEELIEGLVAGGVRIVEVTLPTPESLSTIRRWRARDDVLVGAGTVRTPGDVHSAADAGARFIVTPTTVPAVIAAARERGLPVTCGALTPTEIDAAASLGADWIKVFPVETVGGPAYVSAVVAPLDDIALVPTGGVDARLAERYAELGCAGVGVGSWLVDERSVHAGEWHDIRSRAREITDAWARGSARR